MQNILNDWRLTASEEARLMLMKLSAACIIKEFTFELPEIKPDSQYCWFIRKEVEHSGFLACSYLTGVYSFKSNEIQAELLKSVPTSAIIDINKTIFNFYANKLNKSFQELTLDDLPKLALENMTWIKAACNL